MGTALQRLFSTFPSSWPGFGLLLLRLCVGIALLYFAAAFPAISSEPMAFAQNWIAAGAGIFLMAGLWTPAMGAVIALDEVWIAVSRHAPQRETTWLHMFLAVLAVSVAMLGPGAWSIDARLFGRKRFDIDRASISRSSGRKPSH